MAVDKPRDRPTVPDVLPLVRAIYERHCAGCCLHIVTDDGVITYLANPALRPATPATPVTPLTRDGHGRIMPSLWRFGRP